MTWADRFVAVWMFLRTFLSPRAYALWLAPMMHRIGCPMKDCQDQIHVPIGLVFQHRLTETLTPREFAVVDSLREMLRSGEHEPLWGDAEAGLHAADTICANYDRARRNEIRAKMGRPPEGEMLGYLPESTFVCDACGGEQAWDPTTGPRLEPKTWQCHDEDACAERAAKRA